MAGRLVVIQSLVTIRYVSVLRCIIMNVISDLIDLTLCDGMGILLLNGVSAVTKHFNYIQLLLLAFSVCGPYTWVAVQMSLCSI